MLRVSLGSLWVRMIGLKIAMSSEYQAGKALAFAVKTLVGWGLKVFPLLILFSVFVPFSPKMPAPGLDPSWAFGLNQALAQGLAFGRDIIFTLGPYSSIYTKTYHPATDLLMIAGSCYLAFSYWIAMLCLMKKTAWPWLLVFSLFLLGMLYARDSLLFSYPLMVGLIVYQALISDSLEKKDSHYRWIFLFSPFGLLALIKGSLLLLSLGILLFCFAFFMINRKPLFATDCVLSFTGSILFFWCFTGQKLINLPYYLVQTFSLASGFSEAMAIDGNQDEIIAYGLSAIFLFLVLLNQKQISLISRFFLFSLFFVFLFISYKAGFARHFGHSFIPATSILLAALFFMIVLESKLAWPVLFVASFSWIHINGQHTTISLPNNFVSTLAPAWHGLKNRLGDADWLKNNYEATIAYLREQVPFPLLSGTTDIYSYEQSYLIASQNQWSPRPVFQSYSVFSPKLAEKNRQHLLAKNRPDNIIFRVEPIDNRLPSLEDGLSWPQLMTGYQPSRAVQDFLFLKRREGESELHKNMTVIATEKHQLGEFVRVPGFNQAVFAKIEIKPTIWGVLATLLFKPGQLKINFVLDDGSQKQYRFIAKMAKSGFLLSPLIENTAEFALLYDKESTLGAKRVEAFSISTNDEKSKQWRQDYVVYFSSIKRF